MSDNVAVLHARSNVKQPPQTVLVQSTAADDHQLDVPTGAVILRRVRPLSAVLIIAIIAATVSVPASVVALVLVLITLIVLLLLLLLVLLQVLPRQTELGPVAEITALDGQGRLQERAERDVRGALRLVFLVRHEANLGHVAKLAKLVPDVVLGL